VDEFAKQLKEETKALKKAGFLDTNDFPTQDGFRVGLALVCAVIEAMHGPEDGEAVYDQILYVFENGVK